MGPNPRVSGGRFGKWLFINILPLAVTLRTPAMRIGALVAGSGVAPSLLRPGTAVTATTTGTLLPASSRACASAPWRGGSNTTTSKPLSSSAIIGRRNKSRRIFRSSKSSNALGVAGWGWFTRRGKKH